MSTDGWRNTMRHVCRIKYDWVTERRKCCDSEQCGWAFKTMLHWKHFIYMKRQESANLQTGYRLVVTPHGSAAKNPPDPWVRKIPGRRKYQPTPVLLPGESHGWRSLEGYSPWGRTESDTTERLNISNNTTGRRRMKDDCLEAWCFFGGWWASCRVDCKDGCTVLNVQKAVELCILNKELYYVNYVWIKLL